MDFPRQEKDDDLDSEVSSQELGTTSEVSNTGSKASDDEVNKIKDELAKKESTAVFRLRLIVLAVLMLAATGICVTVFKITRTAELDEFETEYEGSAEKILESFNAVFEEMGSVSGLAVSQTAHSVDHHIPFPFMTMSNFQEKASNARSSSQTLHVSISSIVEKDQLADWDAFVLGGNNSWIDDGYKYQEIAGLNGFEDPAIAESSWLTDRNVDPPHYFDENGKPKLTDTSQEGPYLLSWQASPVLQSSHVNLNLFEDNDTVEYAQRCIQTESAVLSHFVSAPPGSASHEDRTTALFATLQSINEGKAVDYLGDPMAYFLLPIYDSFDINSRKVVGVMKSAIHWRAFLQYILPQNVNGIFVVLENPCDGSYTYEINGAEAYVRGYGDEHDSKFNYMERSANLTLKTLQDGTATGIKLDQGQCPYILHVYPAQKYYDLIVTSGPIIVTSAVAMVFSLTIILFLFYDRLVERRQRLILAKATQSTAIVSALFPKQVRDRLIGAEPQKNGNLPMGPNHRLKTFLNGNTNENDNHNQPIADLFPYCTVFFGDIAGFTAWSSTREPAQVFVLLQAVYQAFDALAKKRRVFKVETIGDSYVAVTGLPEPQANHAIIMVRFAWESLLKMNEITKELEVTLGPDTGELGMRFGLHSGPVTAGVLRGDRARFQLFGDTVNTASRMESTGQRNKIQISQATADALTNAGKAHWIRPREDAVAAKGKGVLKTFWANPVSKQGNSSAASSDAPLSDPARVVRPGNDIHLDTVLKTNRMVGWMVELLLGHVKKIVAVRNIVQSKKPKTSDTSVSYMAPLGTTCIDEVKDSMSMPEFDPNAAAAVDRYSDTEIDPHVVDSLKEYVTLIAATYRSNPFHNFEHACHVTMSVSKLLKRIVAPELTTEQLELAEKGRHGLASHLHDFSHGIVSDPMAVFAITFSALIHDADHRGVSNTQLMKEEPDMAYGYRNKSIAEQNSLDIAWDLLMLEQFNPLRQFIFGTQDELLRFRQIIVNIVLATDIFDKELNDLRKNRWMRAFSGAVVQQPGQKDDDVNDLRAMIVMEHIIQASDVSHTMQHWHVYRKWNRHLFKELYLAYKEGRMDADPSTFWYQGELGFFDNYVIPLAKKLKECNVFGVSSDEYLNYAVLNRAEWEERGQDIVKELVQELKNEFHM